MKFTKRELILIGLLSVFAFMGFMQTRTNYSLFNYGIRVARTPGVAADVFIRNETDGKLTFGTTFNSIGDLEIIGVHTVYNLNIGTSLADGFMPASADTQNGYGLPLDFIIDSLRFYSSDEAGGDSAFFTLYRTTTDAVIISGIDTLVTNGVVDYTNIAAASRDFDASSNEKLAIYVDVKGTYTDALVQIFGRTYDVQ